MNKTVMFDLVHRINPAMVWLLQSRVHRVASSGLMLIRYRGRKSDREFTTPVGLNRFDDTVIILVSDAVRRQWWRNFCAPWPIQLCLQGRWHIGRAVVLRAELDDYAYWLERCLQRSRFMPKLFNLDYDRKMGLSGEDVANMDAYAVIVKVELSGSQ